MTWADIAAGRKPVSSRIQILFSWVNILWTTVVAATPSTGQSASAASAVPDVPAASRPSQASSAQGMSNLNSSFVSMSLANSGLANTQ
jgi:hypothetical protein